jgi:hypothetical protein
MPSFIERILALPVASHPIGYALRICPGFPVSVLLLILYFILPHNLQSGPIVVIYGLGFVLATFSVPISLAYAVALFRRRKSSSFLIVSVLICMLTFLILLATMLIGCAQAARSWMQ